jgi:thioredoxin-like negative regulator of GroEL
MPILPSAVRKVLGSHGGRWPGLVALALVGALAVGLWFSRPQAQAQRERTRGLELAARGQYETAEPLLQRALQADANDFEVLEALARNRLAADKPQDALPYADRCCDLRKDSTGPLKLRVEVLRRVPHVPRAGADGMRVLELDPEDDAFRLDLAQWFRDVGRLGEAYDQARTSYERNPNNAPVVLLLAELAHARGDRQRPAEVLDKLAADQPLPPAAQLLRAVLYEEAGQLDRAIPLLRRAAAHPAQHREALYHLSSDLERTGHGPEAARLKEELRRLADGKPWFENVIAASGIDFQHVNGETPFNYIQESLGSGIAWIDYNNDGWPDLFCVQSGPLRPGDAKGPLPTHKLYRNNGDGTFTDVTEQVGLARSCYGMGCAVGDYDNDGFDDLVVTSFTGVTLYHNESDGHGGRRFVDVTARSGLNDPSWATSCAWGDIDGDGFLDLYVCNYCQVNFKDYPPCKDKDSGKRLVCEPHAFPAIAHQLFRNNRDGTFKDVTFESGILPVPAARGLVVLMADLDGHGLMDIYVGNDADPAYLFHNDGNGHFTEIAVQAGCAFGGNGENVAAMGVDAADVDGSGRPSLFVTNFQDRPNILFVNKGNFLFEDHNRDSGLGPPSLSRLGFGTVFFDADLDGHADIVVANGHIDPVYCGLFGVPYEQEAQLFLGDGRGHFRDVSALAGTYFKRRRVGRGVACADYDNDGRPDLAISHNGGRLALLRNLTPTNNNWVRLELVGDGKKSNRNAIGARVEIEYGDSKQVRFINGGGSYLSASERRLLVGLGAATRVDRVTVFWPSGGGKQEFRNLDPKQWYRLRQGQAKPELVPPLPAPHSARAGITPVSKAEAQPAPPAKVHVSKARAPSPEQRAREPAAYCLPKCSATCFRKMSACARSSFGAGCLLVRGGADTSGWTPVKSWKELSFETTWPADVMNIISTG